MIAALQEYRDAAEAEFVRVSGVQPDSFTVATNRRHTVPYHLIRAKIGDMVIDDSVTLEEEKSWPQRALFVHAANRMAMVYEMKKDSK